MRQRFNRGLSLPEVLVSILILTTTLWALLTLYATLLKGTRISEERQMALVAAETVFVDWKEKLSKDLWNSLILTEDFEGTHEGLKYRVQVGEKLFNPYRSDPLHNERLEVRPLKVTVFFDEKNADRESGSHVVVSGSVSR